MRLADRIAQSHAPLIVRDTTSGRTFELNSATAFRTEIATCPIRYVLSDELARLCTALAYSKGARTLACADLLRVPADRVWIEWNDAPWVQELAQYGLKVGTDRTASGRTGVFVRGHRQGRRGLLRSFWTVGDTECNVLASSMEAYFDFDTPGDEEPEVFDQQPPSALSVSSGADDRADILRRCFRFRFERSWQRYYDSAHLSSAERAAVAHHALGTIAMNIPVMLAFLLLLSARPALPQRPLTLERLNKVRAKAGRAALLEQIEVCAPMLPDPKAESSAATAGFRRTPRLHHVRGHLVRRGNKLFWRMTHLRGSVRAGVARSRTVTWNVGRQYA